ncbi:hypothetical protein HBB16_19645 [Pseudonocardia sp. MCCB 268]|nr:hypothetical protein [Pseudonocardia cytotoxica]
MLRPAARGDQQHGGLAQGIAQALYEKSCTTPRGNR